MISMTTYWMEFKQSLRFLEANGDLDIRLKDIADKLIKIGMKIENMGLLQIKQVPDELYGVSTEFNNSVTYFHDGKDYDFNLPKITNRASLLFSILYYQHLSNYNQVEYQGSISKWMGRGFVVSSVEDKKKTTSIQAAAIFEQIRQYTHSNNIILGDIPLLRQPGELLEDYVNRLNDTLPCEPATKNSMSKLYELGDESERGRLNKVKRQLECREQQTITKINDIIDKLTDYHKASSQYQQLQDHWQNQSWMTKLFYWLTSWFHTSSLSKNLISAKENVEKADEEITQILDPHSDAYCYLSTLQKKVNLIQKELENIQSQLNQTKPESLSIVTKDPSESVRLSTSENIDKNVESGLSANVSEYFSIFKEQLPSAQAMQTVALGLAAGVGLRSLSGV